MLQELTLAEGCLLRLSDGGECLCPKDEGERPCSWTCSLSWKQDQSSSQTLAASWGKDRAGEYNVTPSPEPSTLEMDMSDIGTLKLTFYAINFSNVGNCLGKERVYIPVKLWNAAVKMQHPLLLLVFDFPIFQEVSLKDLGDPNKQKACYNLQWWWQELEHVMCCVCVRTSCASNTKRSRCHHYGHFADEKTESERRSNTGKVTQPIGAEQGFKLEIVWHQSCALRTQRMSSPNSLASPLKPHLNEKLCSI